MTIEEILDQITDTIQTTYGETISELYFHTYIEEFIKLYKEHINDSIPLIPDIYVRWRSIMIEKLTTACSAKGISIVPDDTVITTIINNPTEYLESMMQSELAGHFPGFL
jgi:hypothetical protein